MENDKRYFIEGLFIIVLSIGAAFAFVWLSGTEQRDDVLYRIRFAESVSGMAVGDPVKFHGVDVGSVRSVGIDPDDARLVQVVVGLRNQTPVKTDTRAVLKLKGVTGTVLIELNGGNPKAELLVATTEAGKVPEIPFEKSSINAVLDQLPKVVEKFLVIEDQAKKALNDVTVFTSKVKENPSLLLRRPKDPPEKEAPAKEAPAKK